MASKKKFYVVWEGRNPGVYDDWSDAKEQIENYKGARYKSFGSSQEAAWAYREGILASEVGELGSFMKRLRTQESMTAQGDWRRIAEIDRSAWAVDAACSKNPGPIEYQGVDLATGQKLFHFGPLPFGTNNIAEFLAIVHALALMEQRGERHPIYSDSRTAISWVRNMKIKTQLAREQRTEKLFQMMERAMIWLNTHSFRVPIYKWDTDNWGEIPADFGRK